MLSKVDLEDNGERVDIRYDGNVDFDKLDLYQKSHYRRYEFARDLVTPEGELAAILRMAQGMAA